MLAHVRFRESVLDGLHCLMKLCTNCMNGIAQAADLQLVNVAAVSGSGGTTGSRSWMTGLSVEESVLGGAEIRVCSMLNGGANAMLYLVPNARTSSVTGTSSRRIRPGLERTGATGRKSGAGTSRRRIRPGLERTGAPIKRSGGICILFSSTGIRRGQSRRSSCVTTACGTLMSGLSMYDTARSMADTP